MPTLFRQETRAGLRRAVGSLLDPEGFRYGPVLAATASTVTVEFAKRMPTGAIKGRVLAVSSGVGAGQLTNVTNSTTGSGVLDVVPSFGVTPDTTSVIELWPEGIDPERVNDALNMAVREGSEATNLYVEQANPTLDADRMVITVPAEWTYLKDLLYRTGDGYWRQFQPATYPDYIPPGDPLFSLIAGSIYLREPIPSDVLGANILLRGYRRPALLSADADLCEVHPDFLIYTAALDIDAGRAQGPTLDPEAHQNRSASWLRSSIVARSKLGTDWDGAVVRVRP